MSIQIAERVAVHFSAKPGMTGWGVMIGKTNSGRWAVATIAPVSGNPTYNVMSLPADENEARTIANTEWIGMGL